MVNGILSEEDLKKAEEGLPAFKQTLRDFGAKIEGTLTWGAGIGAFIGPINDILAKREIEVTEENVYLLATALATSFVGEVGKDIYSMTMKKIKEKEKTYLW